jgi:hypothetical protein
MQRRNLRNAEGWSERLDKGDQLTRFRQCRERYGLSRQARVTAGRAVVVMVRRGRDMLAGNRGFRAIMSMSVRTAMIVMSMVRSYFLRPLVRMAMEVRSAGQQTV